MAMAPSHGLKIYLTCPPSNQAQPHEYLRRVQDIARSSEDAGCEGILVNTGDGPFDPWLVSQAIIHATTRLCPLIAIQPAYMHPYSVARMIASLAFFHGRRLCLNMVAEEFKNGSAADHGCYASLIEYTTIIQRLVRSPDPVTFEGRHYRVANLKLTPALPAELVPGVFVSGASEEGVEAARQLGATPLDAPKPSPDYAAGELQDARGRGIRIGIVARANDEEARRIARAPSRSACLVGSYDSVADEVARYVDAGYRTFVLDAPANFEEMRHIGEVFERAVFAFAIG